MNEQLSLLSDPSKWTHQALTDYSLAGEDQEGESYGVFPPQLLQLNAWYVYQKAYVEFFIVPQIICSPYYPPT